MTIIQKVLLILFPSIWGVVEVGLVLRDIARHQGKTNADQGTRRINFIAIIASITLAALLNSVRIFAFPYDKAGIVFFTGVGLMLAGMGLRYWAVITLGASFRTTVETEKGQKVIRTGPYRLIRHPSYAGWLLMCLGYGLALQNWLSLLVMGFIPLETLLHRIAVEEKVLAASLGNEYVEYQQHTKRLIPWVW
jgi:protein-S-isoprenylcysteine O-methyltransferase Ste14